MTPDDVSPNSGKRVWWKCQEGHEWRTKIEHRNSGSGCPYCSGHMVSKENCLAKIKPDLVVEWHPTKNGVLTPYDVVAGSTKKVWWKCNKGHEWKTAIYYRKSGSRCPYCFGVGPAKKVSKDNCLANTHPYLISQWNFNKNSDITPYNITAGSGKKVWWICSKGHEWQASIEKRAKDRSCPICISWRRTSFAEQFLLFYLRLVFENTKSRYKYKANDNRKVELDIYIPELNIGIEYDGSYYHNSNDSIKRDELKNEFAQKNSVFLIRVRAKGLPKVERFGSLIIEHNDQESRKLESLKQCLFIIFDEILREYKLDDSKQKIISNIKLNSKFEQEQGLIYEQMYQGEKEQSLFVTHPELSRQWHPTKNESLKPEHLSFGSNIKVWWKCDNNHVWKAKVADRANKGRGCPYCSGFVVTMENCLATLDPQLSKEWHPKNGELTPNLVKLNSNKKVWWRCQEGHEWKAVVQSRSKGHGCPYCSGLRATKTNSLAELNPELANQWHPTKNGELDPTLIKPGSNRKAWWLCKNGHEWAAVIASRNSGNGCPYCSGQRVIKENSLAAKNANLAYQWHHKKNGNLTPEMVTAGSSKKVWWRCEKGHEWEAVIASRNKGNGCPYCSGKLVSKDNCLAVLNPELAEQWHPFRNGKLTPNDVIPGSSKKVWWLCKKGHEWQAVLYSRNNGTGCPYCYKKRGK